MPIKVKNKQRTFDYTRRQSEVKPKQLTQREALDRAKTITIVRTKIK